MQLQALGWVAGLLCLLGVGGAVLVAGVLVWRARAPQAPAHDAEHALDIELGESLVHEMLGGASSTPEAQEAADNARLYARGGRCAALLEAAARWEAAGGRPRNRGAYNDAKRALETRV